MRKSPILLKKSLHYIIAMKKPTRVYLARSTIEMQAAVAIEILKEERGVSFGKVIEAILHESPTFQKAYDEAGEMFGTRTKKSTAHAKKELNP
ncbi:MAG: hypothetical protein JXK05_13315 [Campylobacterales bacterium]|nr:hypothetical protein [Campylobacterales bacterium]